MNRDWKKSARQAQWALAHSQHGEREAALRTAIDDAGWKDVNTVRRAVLALDYLDELQRAHPYHYDQVSEAPFSVIEALARLHRLDQLEALKAASDWASGKHSLKTLREAAKRARPAGLYGRTGQFLEDEYRQLAETRVRKVVQRIVGTRLSTVHISYKDAPEAPHVDYFYSSKSKTSRLGSQTIAVLIVGPYQNVTLYRKRRFDWILRAFGLAWYYDHVVLVLPSKFHLKDYNLWISRYQESINKHEPPDKKRKKAEQKIIGRRTPNVHVIDIEIPIFDAEDDAALSSLAT